MAEVPRNNLLKNVSVAYFLILNLSLYQHIFECPPRAPVLLRPPVVVPPVSPDVEHVVDGRRPSQGLPAGEAAPPAATKGEASTTGLRLWNIYVNKRKVSFQASFQHLYETLEKCTVEKTALSLVKFPGEWKPLARKKKRKRKRGKKHCL